LQHLLLLLVVPLLLLCCRLDDSDLAEISSCIAVPDEDMQVIQC
jgi:hypothetical protein